jgi:hypothetical protein
MSAPSRLTIRIPRPTLGMAQATMSSARAATSSTRLSNFRLWEYPIITSGKTREAANLAIDFRVIEISYMISSPATATAAMK